MPGYLWVTAACSIINYRWPCIVDVARLQRQDDILPTCCNSYVIINPHQGPLGPIGLRPLRTTIKAHYISQRGGATFKTLRSVPYWSFCQNCFVQRKRNKFIFGRGFTPELTRYAKISHITLAEATLAEAELWLILSQVSLRLLISSQKSTDIDFYVCKQHVRCSILKSTSLDWLESLRSNADCQVKKRRDLNPRGIMTFSAHSESEYKARRIRILACKQKILIILTGLSRLT